MVRRGFIVAGLVAALLPAMASAAAAHSAVVSSQPPPGAELSTAPGVVTISFTEPLNRELSGVNIRMPDGSVVHGRPTLEAEIRAVLSTNQPGLYVVDWTTVSVLDGHTLRGSFRFGVGVAPGGSGGATVNTAPAAADLLVSVFRTSEYAALLLAIGLLVLRRLSRRKPELGWARAPVRPALVVALTAGVAVVVGESVIAAGWSTGRVASYLTTGLPGVARSARLVAEVAGVLVAWAAVAWAAPVAALTGLAAAGHAAAVEPRWLGIGVDVVHLVAAGVWVGGILALALQDPPGGWRDGKGRALLDRFSPVALGAFTVTVAAGIGRGLQELGSLEDLVRTAYGTTLLVKVLAVLVMTQLSLLAWRRIVGSPRAEAALALGVIAIAALLAAYPLPPARLAEANEAAERAEAGRSALPRAGDLTFGAAAGEVLVGFTIRPAEPGTNDVLVHLVPLGSEASAAGLPVELSVGGRTIAMADCGSACRQTRVELAGGEGVSVVVGGPGGGTASIEVPALPAADGSRLFERAQVAMHGLRTFRLDEELSSGVGEFIAHYAFAAPDRARWSVEGGGTNVSIGGTRYFRESPGAAWLVARGAPPLDVPTFVWDGFAPPGSVFRVGTELIDGTRADVLASFGSSAGAPAWFRLWVSPGGWVLRAEMRAQGHFMDQRYFAFDALLSIEAPVEEEET